MPAVWVIAIAIASVAVFVAGSSHVRSADVPASRATSAGEVEHPANAQAAFSAGQRGRIRASFDALPLTFEANQGQTDPQVKYIARGKGYTAFLTADETRFVVTSAAGSAARRDAHSGRKLRQTPPVQFKTAKIDMRLVGANAKPALVAGAQVPGTINYYVGNDRSQWQLGVKQYARVSYHNVYPGVEMAFHGEQRQLEFDFIVAPGSNAEAIRMGFTGTQQMATDGSGNLVLSSSAGDVVLQKPVAYQERNGQREPVEVAFQAKNRDEVSFILGSYDHARELVIDPSLSYATYLGGAGEDEAFGIALDGSGNTYITGQTDSIAFNGKPAGPTFNVFVTKLNSTGTTFSYTDIFVATGAGARCSTSGTGSCSGNAIAVDGSGNAYVAGSATGGFPIASAFQSTFGGGASDGFVLKLNSSGALAFSSFLGGSNSDDVNGIAVDGSGNIYVVGETHSTNFPTVSPIQGTNASGDSAFVTKINSSGATLAYSTYLGGSNVNLATGIALDSSNNAYVTGITDSSDFPTTTGVAQSTFGGVEDGFVTEVKADGSAWVYSTYVGGGSTDDALAIAVDAAGEAYVTGDTNSSNFPTVNAAQAALGGSSAINVFVTKLSAGGTAFLFSTYYGGNLDDAGTGIALDSFGDAYVTGRATSANYPTSQGSAFQTSLSGSSDAFVTEFSNTGFVEYSSYLGGTGTENDALSGSDTEGPIGAIAVDSSSNAYVAGSTASTAQFPVSAGAAQSTNGGGLADAFVAKVGPAPADFSVAVSPSTTSVSSGGTTSAITVTVSSVNASFGQAVTLSCGNLPSKAACNFSVGSVTPGATPGTSSLTISTNASASASLMAPNSNRHLTVLAALLLPVVGIALLGSGVGTRRKKLLGLLLVGIVLMGLVMLPACGGSSGGGGGGGGGTPPGSYNFTVSGAAGGVTHSVPVALTVN